jgi:chromosome segregation ATPase
MSEPTPKTDALSENCVAHSVMEDHARQLERELSAARTKLAERDAEVERFRNGYQGACFACEPVAMENIKLRERAAQAEAKNIALTKAIENLKECLDQAEAEREALRVDAERYRFLADSNNYEESVKLISANLTEYQLDAAIDEARGVKP